MTEAGQQLKAAGQRAGDSKALETVARVGMVAHGLTYTLIGLLAAQIALGEQANASKTGALRAVARQPLGEVLLWVLAVGFAGYAIWQASEAAWGHRAESDAKQRSVARLGNAGKAVLFAVFTWSTITLLLGTGSSGGATSTTAKALDLPGGQLIVGAAGVVTVAVGCYVGWHGWRHQFEDDLDTGSIPAAMRPVVLLLGKVGHIALGCTVALIGVLLTSAAVTHEARRAAGFDESLQTLSDQPFGGVLLLVLAAGLLCYGAYGFCEARYHKL